ncbi:MAG: B12-binding domain-containing radical SAM protein, partial [Myxococcales bacterium]|nr:B12-binding domain-containing radical SAM protein [Myxococcales bacterium]
IESDDPIPAVIASDTFTRADWDVMNAISRALRDTQGAHPRDVETLLAGARDADAEPRWSPPKSAA